jgi:hypothetical protein
MSVTANEFEVKSIVGDDYGYATIALTWKGKRYLEYPNDNEKTKVLWSHDGPFGVVGAKIGDFICCYGDGSRYYGSVFTHRPIAEYLVENFTGLKYKELEWLENPLEKTLSSGKPRIKKAKWLPGHPADIVHLYSDAYIDADDQTSVATDFFTVFRNHKKWVAKRLMCSDGAAEKIKTKLLLPVYTQDRNRG